jgi:broad specificity phosphatase PhoE
MKNIGGNCENIITIQHTQVEHHVKKMVGGDTDWPLTDFGKEQAHKIGKKLL